MTTLSQAIQYFAELDKPILLTHLAYYPHHHGLERLAITTYQSMSTKQRKLFLRQMNLFRLTELALHTLSHYERTPSLGPNGPVGYCGCSHLQSDHRQSHYTVQQDGQVLINGGCSKCPCTMNPTELVDALIATRTWLQTELDIIHCELVTRMPAYFTPTSRYITIISPEHPSGQRLLIAELSPNLLTDLLCELELLLINDSPELTELFPSSSDKLSRAVLWRRKQRRIELELERRSQKP